MNIPISNGAIRNVSVSLDLECLTITEYGATKGIPSAHLVTYKVNENDGWSFDGKDKITFKASYENSSLSQQTITVSIQKKISSETSKICHSAERIK